MFSDRRVVLVIFAGIYRGNRWIVDLTFYVRAVVPVPCWYAPVVQRMTWFLAQAVANFRWEFDRSALDRALGLDTYRWPFQWATNPMTKYPIVRNNGHLPNARAEQIKENANFNNQKKNRKSKICVHLPPCSYVCQQMTQQSNRPADRTHQNHRS